MRVVNLSCEYQRTPLGITTAEPRLGWQIESKAAGCLQRGFHIQVVSGGQDFGQPVWDTDWVDSRRSQLVPYSGPELAPWTRYSWRVRIRTTAGESEWSEPSWFETSGLDSVWTAPFTGAPRLDEPASSRPLYLRREFECPAVPGSARLYATALGLYELYLNGVRVGDALFTPGWTNYHKRLAYQTYDVTDMILPGTNVLGAVVGPGWYKGYLGWLDDRNLFGQHLALSVILVSDGETVVTTHRGWKASHGPIVSSEIYHGEISDARQQLGEWASAGYDAGSWIETDVIPFPAERIVPQDGPYVRRQETILPVRQITTPNAERVIDFGQNLTGWVRFRVRGSAGDRVVLKHAEVIDTAGNFYTDNMRSARNTIEYALSGGETEQFEPHFTFQGFRYVHVLEYPGHVDPSEFEAVAVHSDMEPTLEFSCSNDLLNQLHHNILWGWKGNSLDIPTDCPQRDERLGWTGDAQVFVGTASYLMNVHGFFVKWLRDMASEQRPDGGVPFVVPDILPTVAEREPMMKDSHSSTGWADAVVVCPWTIFERYGDERILGELYPSMRDWVEYMRAHAQDEVLWNTGFHFGDWLALDAKEGSYLGATPNDFTATAYYSYSTKILAESAAVLGNEEDAAGFADLHRRIVDAFRREFYTPSGRLAVRTQTAHVLSLVFGLAPEEHRDRTVRDLVTLIHENGDALSTGFLGTPLLCRALSENGELDLAYSLLLRTDYPSWLYQVTQGATTIWEHWDGLKPDGSMWSPKMNSFNHYAYGAVGEWIYRNVGGIDLKRLDHENPRFRFAPRPGGGITSCETRYKTAYGELRLAWRIDNGTLHLTAVVPPNTTAELDLATLERPLELVSGVHEIEQAIPAAATGRDRQE